MTKRLTPGRINRLFGVILSFFLAVAGVLYWQGQISLESLLLVAILTLVAGVAFTFGVRTAQKDGFLDGYARAKNNFDKKKKT